MSISTLQEKFFNQGCGSALIVVAAVAMGASLFTRNAGGSSSSRQGPNGETENAVAMVDGVPVFASAIQRQAGALAERMGSANTSDPSMKAMVEAQATGTLVQIAAIQAILAKGTVADAEIAAAARSAAERELQEARSRLTAEGRLKPNSTDADLEAVLKAERAFGGKTLADFRADYVKEAIDRYKDESTRSSVFGQFGYDILRTRLGEKAVGSDQALRDSYRTYTVRRIFLGASSGSKETPEARAAKAEADLKAGKSFESVMDAYSNAPAPTGKKPHDVTETVAAADLDARPEYASLKGKTAPATTGVVDVEGGKAILQLVSAKENLPPNFEKDKVKLRAQKAVELGAAEAERQIKALLATDAVKWESPGYRALMLTSQALQPMGNMALILDAKAGKAAVDAGLAALKSENAGERRLGAEALMVATDPKTSILKSPESAADRTAALKGAVANGMESPALWLELAGLYGDAKDGSKATDALVAASKANVRYDAEGERLFREVAAKALDLQGKSTITATQLQSVQSQQALWTAMKADDAKAAVGAKLSEAELKRANEAEVARQMAEAAKANPTPAPPKPTDDATKKANEAAIARQKAAANVKSAPAKGGSLLPTTAGSGQ